MLHSLGSAGTQAAGLWECLRDDADSKQLHTAKAAGIITSVRLENAATAGAGTAVTLPFERVAHLR